MDPNIRKLLIAAGLIAAGFWLVKKLGDKTAAVIDAATTPKAS